MATQATLSKEGIAKVPVVMQLEALECGAACLDMILAYFGRWVPLEEVRRDCGISRNGSKASSIVKAAKGYGCEAHAYRFDAQMVKQMGRFPCIIHWGLNHFVVLDGFKKDGSVVLNDPARGRITLPWETFNSNFTGYVVEIEPGEGFEPGGEPEKIMPYVIRRLKGMKPVLALTAATTAIVSLIGLVTPAFSNVFVDRLLTGDEPEWVTPFVLLMAGLALANFIASWVRVVSGYRMQGLIASTANAQYMWHVLRLPIEFFSQRTPGDLMNRKAENQTIAYQIVTTIAPLTVQGAMLVFYLVVMVHYNLVLALLGVLSTGANLALGQLVSQRRVDVTRVTSRDASAVYNATVGAVDLIETIKASGAEEGYFRNWGAAQASASASGARLSQLNANLTLLPQVVETVSNTLILMASAYLVMSGQWTVGVMTAFTGILTAFTAPATQLVSATQDLQEMRTSMERIRDVMDYPCDVPDDADESDQAAVQKLTGRIELRDITFSYSRLDLPLIEGFNMTIEPGQKVAFVGSSGCGKSTLAKLMSGLYQPWSGQVLYDGVSLEDIDRTTLTASVAVVDQEITIFEDTIAENIRFWDESIDKTAVERAARDAQIHDDILARPDGYDEMLTAKGGNLSGGQRQRIEIARVLAADPSIVIMDEATSALDAKTEFDVVEAVRERGVTNVVIAHRLSTIRDCDEIVVLDHGHVVERGTHETLYAAGGRYHELVTSD